MEKIRCRGGEKKGKPAVRHHLPKALSPCGRSDASRHKIRAS